jgi:hypothetical protein
MQLQPLLSASMVCNGVYRNKTAMCLAIDSSPIKISFVRNNMAACNDMGWHILVSSQYLHLSMLLLIIGMHARGNTQLIVYERAQFIKRVFTKNRYRLCFDVVVCLVNNDL